MKISEKLKTGLTNAEKIECYKKVINYLENASLKHGICKILKHQFEDSFKYLIIESIPYLFPEFNSRKPASLSYGCIWFNSNAERIQVLNELIAELS